MCGFRNVWLCEFLCFVLYGCVCVCEGFNVWLCVYVSFVMCGSVYVLVF